MNKRPLCINVEKQLNDRFWLFFTLTGQTPSEAAYSTFYVSPSHLPYFQNVPSSD